MAVKQLKLLIGWRRISTVRPGRRKREFWGQQPHNSLLPCVIFFSQNFFFLKKESRHRLLGFVLSRNLWILFYCNFHPGKVLKHLQTDGKI